MLLGTTFLLYPQAYAATAYADVTCAKQDGTEQTYQIGWDNSNQFFANRGYIPRLFCEGGYAPPGFTVYISDNLSDSSTGYYNGVVTTPVVSPNPETQTVQSETATAPSESSTAPSSESVTASETATTTSDTQTSTTETTSATVDTPTSSTESPTPVLPAETSTVDTQTVESNPTPEVTPLPEPVPIVPPEPIVAPPPAPEPEPIPDPAPEPEPEPEEPPVPVEEPPAPEEEPPAEEEQPPVEEEEPPVPVEEPPAEAEEPPAEAEEPPVEAELPPEPAPEPPAEEPEPPMVADEDATEEEKAEVAQAIIEEAQGQPVTAEAIQAAGLTYADLPAETPVEVRQDENGNEVVITAEVAAALMVLENPGELLNAIFTDPAQALLALSSIGADMSTEERAESEKTIVAAVIVGQIAGQAAVTAAGAAGAYRRKP
jgi:hypothetical protein